jgi:hypothetical protein
MVASATPYLAIGQDAEVFLTGTATMRYDDNILLVPKNQTSDTVFDLTPGLELEYKGGRSKAVVTVDEQFERYASNSPLNTNLFGAVGKADYDDAVSKVAFNTMYRQLGQYNLDIRSADQAVRRNVFDITLDGIWDLTAKSRIGTGIF